MPIRVVQKEQVLREGKANCKHMYVHFRKDVGSTILGCDQCGMKKVFPPSKIEYPTGAYIRLLKGPVMGTYRWKADENGTPRELPANERVRFEDISRVVDGG